MPITIKNSASGGITLDSSTSSNETINLNTPVFTGNVGVGVAPASWASPAKALQVGSTAGFAEWNNGSSIISIVSSNSYFNSGYKYSTTNTAAMIRLSNGSMDFRVAPSGSAGAAITFTTAMTMTNTGQVGIGSPTAVSNNYILNLKARASQSTVKLQSNNGYDAIDFYNAAGSQNGFIRSNTSSIVYATSSDYRLKENVTAISGATAAVKLLKPCNFDWIVGGNVNGFLAHELAEVVPEAVSGTKDAMKDEEYEVTAATDTEAAVMGTRSVPDLQGIDQSKLVPLLTATIQELIARIETLENV